MLSGINYYYIGDIIVECRVYDDNMCILDSYKVTSDEDKEYIVEDLLNSFPWFKESRTKKDMLNEWRAHNYFYSIKFRRANTQNTDIEIKLSLFHRFVYWFVSKVVRKDI